MTNLDSILKNRDITLPTKIHLVKAMVFLIVMYGCESWTIKKAEGGRIDAFELCYWRRLLRAPWTARRSNQSILKEISLNIHWKDWCWSWNSIFWSLDAKSWLIWKDPDVGKDWRPEEKGKTGWDGWMASPTQWAWIWVNSSNWWWTGRPSLLQFMGSQRVGHDWVTELNWTEWASLVAQLVKNLHAMRETWIWSLDWEDPLEKGTATHSTILAWRIPWTV